jgi:hypothetical protein
MKTKITLLFVLWVSLSFGQIMNITGKNYLHDDNRKALMQNRFRNTVQVYKKLDSLVEKTWDNGTAAYVNDYKEHYQYDVNGNVTQYISYDWDLSINDWVIDEKQEFSYDSQNRLLEMVYWDWDSSTNSLEREFKKQNVYNGNLLAEEYFYDWDDTAQVWNQQVKHVYNYDANDYLIKMEEFVYYNNSWNFNAETDYTNDSNGNVLEEVNKTLDYGTNQLVNSSKTQYVYNSNNLLVEKTEYNWDETNNQWENDNKYLKSYNQANQLIEEVEQYWASNQWINDYKTEIVYDANDNIVEEIYYYWNSSNWEYDEKLEVDYDNTYPLSQLLLPFFIYEYEEIIMFFNHMPYQYRQYVWDGSNWGQEDSLSGELYYSDINLNGIFEKTPDLVKVFPNPVQRQLFIGIKDIPADASITITDLSGQELLSKELNSRLNTIDLQGLSKGIYLYRIINERQVYTGKFIKQ